MGIKNSKTTVNIVNEIVPNVILQHAQNCSANVVQDMTYVNSGFSLFSSKKQTNTINLSCLANFKMNANIVADIANKIQQESETQGIAVLDAISSSKADANLKLQNIIAPKITSELVQRAVVNVTQTMKIMNTGTEIGSSYLQSSDIVLEAIMQEVNNTGLAVDIDNNTTQKSSTKSENPFNFLTNIATIWIVAILLVVVLIVGSIIYIFS